jgi:hypothetical protein
MLHQNQILALMREINLIFLSLPLILLFWYSWTTFRSPLRQYPGPLLASKFFHYPGSTSVVISAEPVLLLEWTNLWRLYHVSTGNSHQVFHDLHKKYGPVVRLGPNLLDLDYPELIKTIYNIQGNWKKVSIREIQKVNHLLNNSDRRRCTMAVRPR